jgi:hypothetical protein
VPADQDIVLRPGDRFSIGADVFLFENPAVAVLREIEAAEDDAMRADENPEMPRSTVVPEVPARVSAHFSAESPPENSKQSDVQARDGDAKDVARERRSVHPRNKRKGSKKKNSGWRKSDILIVLLALVVLGLSALGLGWLCLGG